VREDEDLPDAARRELAEETGLGEVYLEQIAAVGTPGRDPRGHTVSLVYIATATGEPVAGDDAAAVLVVDPGDAPPLAFDHRRILDDYLRRIEFQS